MQKLLFVTCLFLWSKASMSAQCLSQPSCPAASQTVCDTTGNNAYYWNDPLFTDPVAQGHDLGEVPTELSMQIIDSCGPGDVQASFVLFLDLNGDGVRETAISSEALPGTGLVYYGNAANPNYTGGEAKYFDTRPVPTDQKYEFALEKIVQDSLVTVRVRWTNALIPNGYVLPQLPNGTHRIEWHFEKDGATRTCGYAFTVEDCRPPTVTCINGLALSIVPTSPPLLQLGVLDFLQYAEDNYTPTGQLQYAIRRSGTGVGFPTNSPSVQFTCAELGTQPVEIWVKDLAGNTSFCETYVIVQDNLGACQWEAGNYEACVQQHCNGESVPEVLFLYEVNAPALPPFDYFAITDDAGCVSFNNAIPISTNLTVTPSKDDYPLNGVTTYDLVLISRHILGLASLGSPYKLIAADADKSGSVISYDILQLRRLILGIDQELPNNTSWRFVDKAFAFPNPYNPFATAFPENKTIAAIQQSQWDGDFVGVKIGDVDCSALQPPAQILPEEALTIPDLHLQTDDIVEVPVRFLQTNDYYGFQFGLHFDPTSIELLELIPEVGDLNNFAVFPDRVNTSWSSAAPLVFLPDAPIFRLRIKALAPVQLADVFSLTTGLLHAEAYPVVDTLARLTLQFETVATTEPDAARTIFAPLPNPTTAGARIALRLEQSETVTVEVLDGTGRLLYHRMQTEGAGPQWLELPATAFPQAGVYFWRVQAGQEARVGKIMKQ